MQRKRGGQDGRRLDRDGEEGKGGHPMEKREAVGVVASFRRYRLEPHLAAALVEDVLRWRV